MFNLNKSNIILLSDFTTVLSMYKTVGPFRIASELRKAGYEVAVIHHTSVFTLDEIKLLLSNLISHKTLFVGINNFFYADIGKILTQPTGGVAFGLPDPGSFLPHGKKYNQELKTFIKTLNRNCQLVLGGPSANDQSYNNDFDFVVMGYADKSIVNLAQHLEDSSVALKDSYKSILGPIILNDSRAAGFNFVESQTVYENTDGVLPDETLSIEISRGCIFKCAFCSYPLNGKKKLDYLKTKQCLINEFTTNYKKFGITKYMFSDDTVNDSPEKCKMIYEISQHLPFQLQWWGYIRLDLIRAHPETLNWLFDSGLRGAFFGIETLNARTASIIGKGGDRGQLLSTIKKIKDIYGDSISLHGSFIFGLPEESMQSMQETADFLLSEQNPLDTWAPQPLVIKPSNLVLNDGFFSDLDKNYQKYGYTDKGQVTVTGDNYTSVRWPGGIMNWQNQFTDYEQIKEFVYRLDQDKLSQTKVRMRGLDAFELSGLGIPLSHLLNKSLAEVDWHHIDKVKFLRSQQYKKQIFQNLLIPWKSQEQQMPDYTFSQWLRDQKL